MVSQVEPFGQNFQRSWTNSWSPQISPLLCCSWAVSVPQGAGEKEERRRITPRESNPTYGFPTASEPPHHLPRLVSYWDSWLEEEKSKGDHSCSPARLPLPDYVSGATQWVPGLRAAGATFQKACSRSLGKGTF